MDVRGMIANETEDSHKHYSYGDECRRCDWISVADDSRKTDGNVMPSTDADGISNEFNSENNDCILIQKTCKKMQDELRIY
jgi:hypothetical protein